MKYEGSIRPRLTNSRGLTIHGLRHKHPEKKPYTTYFTFCKKDLYAHDGREYYIHSYDPEHVTCQSCRREMISQGLIELKYDLIVSLYSKYNENRSNEFIITWINKWLSEVAILNTPAILAWNGLRWIRNYLDRNKDISIQNAHTLMDALERMKVNHPVWSKDGSVVGIIKDATKRLLPHLNTLKKKPKSVIQIKERPNPPKIGIRFVIVIENGATSQALLTVNADDIIPMIKSNTTLSDAQIVKLFKNGYIHIFRSTPLDIELAVEEKITGLSFTKIER